MSHAFDLTSVQIGSITMVPVPGSTVIVSHEDLVELPPISAMIRPAPLKLAIECMLCSSSSVFRLRPWMMN